MWTRREETKAVKEALTAAGIQARKVGHGRGTASTWLEVFVGENPGGLQHEKMPDVPWRCQGGCPACERNREMDQEVHRIVGEVTGRGGEYNGNVLVLHQ